MVSIGTNKGRKMFRHYADCTTKGRQMHESHDESRWSATFGKARRTDKGRSRYVLRDGQWVMVWTDAHMSGKR